MIEVMVALLVTAIAIIGIIALYMTGTKASSFTRHATEASVLANDKLEDLRTMATPGSDSEGNLNEQGTTDPAGIFTRTWTVAAQPDFYDFTVTVSWVEEDDSKEVVVRGKRSL